MSFLFIICEVKKHVVLAFDSGEEHRTGRILSHQNLKLPFKEDSKILLKLDKVFYYYYYYYYYSPNRNPIGPD